MMKPVMTGLVAILTAGWLMAAGTPHEKAVAERISPIGNVCIQGEECATANAVATASVSSEPRAADEVYQAACFACHGTGAAGAPKLGDAAAWSPRRDKGVDVLVDHAINGFNAMPPKGGCGNCSNEEIEAAVSYILENS